MLVADAIDVAGDSAERKPRPRIPAQSLIAGESVSGAGVLTRHDVIVRGGILRRTIW